MSVDVILFLTGIHIPVVCLTGQEVSICAVRTHAVCLCPSRLANFLPRDAYGTHMHSAVGPI